MVGVLLFDKQVGLLRKPAEQSAVGRRGVDTYPVLVAEVVGGPHLGVTLLEVVDVLGAAFETYRRETVALKAWKGIFSSTSAPSERQ